MSSDIIVHGQGDSIAVDKAIEEIRLGVGARFHPAAVKAMMALALGMASAGQLADDDRGLRAPNR